MIKAFGDRIILEMIDLKPNKQKGSLILPDKDRHVTGRVVAFGSDLDSDIELGDIVYIPRGSGTEIEINGESYVSITSHQVIAAWKDE